MQDTELTTAELEPLSPEVDKVEAAPGHRRYDLFLVFVTMIWGSTFLVVKNTVSISGPFMYLACAYGVGTLMLALLFRKRLRRITIAELRRGLFIGAFLFTGYALQTVGLQFTSVSKAGFITGVSVPLVPLFALLFLRQKPHVMALVGIFFSFAGLLLLSLNSQFNLVFGLGELLILGCAFAFALHVIAISKFTPGMDALNLSIIQMGVTSLCSVLFIPLTHEAFKVPPMIFWVAVLGMGTFDLALGVASMNRIQQFISSTRASLIYALEPMWAALAGFVLAGDRLSAIAWLGCGLIFIGMIVGRIERVRMPWRKKHAFSQ